MTQQELNQAVAASTGESIREVRHRGFSVMKPAMDDEPEIYAPPQVIDWDSIEEHLSRAA
jgi:hypothetical protein